jgi:hypothetical protein
VIVALAPAAMLVQIAAGIEEEGVPFEAIERSGGAFELAREAARGAPGGIGIGGDADRVVVCLAAWAHEPYLDLPATSARQAGHAAGRLTTRRPLAFMET